jgi:hypothetical protein
VSTKDDDELYLRLKLISGVERWSLGKSPFAMNSAVNYALVCQDEWEISTMRPLTQLTDFPTYSLSKPNTCAEGYESL